MPVLRAQRLNNSATMRYDYKDNPQTNPNNAMSMSNEMTAASQKSSTVAEKLKIVPMMYIIDGQNSPT